MYNLNFAAQINEFHREEICTFYNSWSLKVFERVGPCFRWRMSIQYQVICHTWPCNSSQVTRHSWSHCSRYEMKQIGRWTWVLVTVSGPDIYVLPVGTEPPHTTVVNSVMPYIMYRLHHFCLTNFNQCIIYEYLLVGVCSVLTPDIAQWLSNKY